MTLRQTKVRTEAIHCKFSEPTLSRIERVAERLKWSISQTISELLEEALALREMTAQVIKDRILR